MHLNKFFEGWKRVRKNRNKYRMQWAIRFDIYDDPFSSAIIPTIIYTPWFHLIPNSDYDRMFEFVWLNLYLGIGKLETIEGQ